MTVDSCSPGLCFTLWNETSPTPCALLQTFHLDEVEQARHAVALGMAQNDEVHVTRTQGQLCVCVAPSLSGDARFPYPGPVEPTPDHVRRAELILQSVLHGTDESHWTRRYRLHRGLPAALTARGP